MKKKHYTATYRAERGGWSYELRCNGKYAGQGWVLGHKRNAEREVRDEVAKLQAKEAA